MVNIKTVLKEVIKERAIRAVRTPPPELPSGVHAKRKNLVRIFFGFERGSSLEKILLLEAF